VFFSKIRPVPLLPEALSLYSEPALITLVARGARVFKGMPFP